MYGMGHPETVGPADCYTAECMSAPGACSNLEPLAIYFLSAIALVAAAAISMFSFALYLIIGLKRNGESLLSVAGTTLISAACGTPFQVMWAIAYPFDMINPPTWSNLGTYGIPFGLGFCSIFQIISLLNIALMWYSVAKASKTMKRTGRNLSAKYRIYVAIYCFLSFLILFVLLTIMENYTIGSGVAIIIFIGIGIAYALGARELRLVLSTTGDKTKRSPRLLKILSTSRKMQIVLWAQILAQLVFAGTFMFRSVRPTIASVIHIVALTMIISMAQSCTYILLDYNELAETQVAVWIDYSCINQINDEDKQKGIDSLIAYAARSDYLLIPVFPDAASVNAFVGATHPMHLGNFGNRAWCRLE
eukprot:g5174.t1